MGVILEGGCTLLGGLVGLAMTQAFIWVPLTFAVLLDYPTWPEPIAFSPERTDFWGMFIVVFMSIWFTGPLSLVGGGLIGTFEERMKKSRFLTFFIPAFVAILALVLYTNLYASFIGRSYTNYLPGTLTNPDLPISDCLDTIAAQDRQDHWILCPNVDVSSLADITTDLTSVHANGQLGWPYDKGNENKRIGAVKDGYVFVSHPSLTSPSNAASLYVWGNVEHLHGAENGDTRQRITQLLGLPYYTDTQVLYMGDLDFWPQDGDNLHQRAQDLLKLYPGEPATAVSRANNSAFLFKGLKRLLLTLMFTAYALGIIGLCLVGATL